MENDEIKDAEVVEVMPQSAEPSKSERQWATGCHLAALAGYFVPVASIIAPLVVWLLKRADGAFVDDQGKESLNFQISLLIYFFISILLIPVLGLGIFLLGALVIFDFVCIIIAATKSSEGIAFRYPACIRFIK